MFCYLRVEGWVGLSNIVLEAVELQVLRITPHDRWVVTTYTMCWFTYLFHNQSCRIA